MLSAEQYKVDFSIFDSHIAADLDRTFKEGEKTNTAGLEQSKRMKVKTRVLPCLPDCLVQGILRPVSHPEKGSEVSSPTNNSIASTGWKAKSKPPVH